VALLALTIRERSDGQQVGRSEQRDTIVERQPLIRVKLVVDFRQTGRLDSGVHRNPLEKFYVL
jgi:hypothetical protein